MHEVLHTIGLCPDSFAHFDLIDLIVANYENLTYIKPKSIKNYVIKRRQSNLITQHK